MSNVKIEKVVKMIENGKATINEKEVCTVADLKAIAGKTFKDLLEKEPELLHPFKTYVKYHVVGSKKSKNQLYLFTKEEVLAAGEFVKDEHGKDLQWIPAADDSDTPYVAFKPRNAATLESLEEKPIRINSITNVVRVKTVAMKTEGGLIIEPETDHVLIPFSHAGSKWRGVKKGGTGTASKTDKALAIAMDSLKEATDAKDKNGIKSAQKMIDILTKLQTTKK